MLHHHLNIVCDDVWNRLKDSKRLGISQGEETLTDNILLYLSQKNIKDIRIIQTPKNIESIKGTDWEWWIGNSSTGYLRYAVQAKKLNSKTNTYTTLNHKVGKKPHQEYQHVILEKYAKANGAIPIYAFYNHIEKDDYSKYWNCPLPIDIPKFGCTITTLKNVKKAISTRGCRTFEKIHKFSETIPIRCLAECPKILAIYSGSTKDSIYKFGVEAKIYKNAIDSLSEIQFYETYEQLPEHLYNHEVGYYPKRILVIETNEEQANKLIQRDF